MTLADTRRAGAPTRLAVAVAAWTATVGKRSRPQLLRPRDPYPLATPWCQQHSQWSGPSPRPGVKFGARQIVKCQGVSLFVLSWAEHPEVATAIISRFPTNEQGERHTQYYLLLISKLCWSITIVKRIVCEMRPKTADCKHCTCPKHGTSQRRL